LAVERQKDRPWQRERYREIEKERERESKREDDRILKKSLRINAESGERQRERKGAREREREREREDHHILKRDLRTMLKRVLPPALRYEIPRHLYKGIVPQSKNVTTALYCITHGFLLLLHTRIFI